MAKKSTAIKNNTKKEEGAVKKLERDAARATITSLSGVAISSFSKKQMDDYLIAIGQLAGVVDITGKIK